TSLDGSVIIGKSPSLGAADLDGIVAIGDTVAVNAENGIAIGAGAVVAAGHTNSVAIGAGATTTAANQVALAGSLTGVTYID
ncbi:MAG: hypothetical protein GWN58_24640, partial [Anaerolineae bacterium]|nr:hypothetical protein [Anaerolineae bacterium]